MPELTERFWKHLINFIDEGKVIPIVGPELCTVSVAGPELQLPLHTWLAQRLAEAMDLLPPLSSPQSSQLPAASPDAQAALPATPHWDLHQVVAQHVRQGGSRKILYNEIATLLREAKLLPSPALLALASIPRFDLFVSLNFDDLLSQALAQARPAAQIEHLSFLPNEKQDLSSARIASPKAQRQPLIFHLLGKLPTPREFVICEDDMLEFAHALQDTQRQPVALFAEMRKHHLLILGCGFSDWLARFFLRAMRSDEFPTESNYSSYLVGGQTGHDEKLRTYLQEFSADHKTHPSTDDKILPMPATDFVLELARRWHAAHPQPSSAVSAAAPSATTALPEYGAVFISFSSKNRSLVTNMAQQLSASGVEVWLDSKDLQVGDAWNLRIERAIARCSLFLAVISQESIDPDQRDRYFWYEWNLANERAKHHAPDLPFIIPVLVDDTDFERLPDVLHQSFTAKQGKHLPDGQITPEFAERLRELQRDYRRRKGLSA